MLCRNDYIVVCITASSPEEARLLAEKLVSSKSAACVNLTPVDSFFTWQGKNEESKEILLIAKTQLKKFTSVEKIVKQYHSYEVPEIIALPVVKGSAAYLKWVKDSTS